MSYLWSELKRFAEEGETFLEGLEEHVAVLTARLLHSERVKAAAAVEDVAAVVAPPAEKSETPAEKSES
jgi:hypothetical protein